MFFFFGNLSDLKNPGDPNLGQDPKNNRSFITCRCSKFHVIELGIEYTQLYYNKRKNKRSAPLRPQIPQTNKNLGIPLKTRMEKCFLGIYHKKLKCNTQKVFLF